LRNAGATRSRARTEGRPAGEPLGFGGGANRDARWRRLRDGAAPASGGAGCAVSGGKVGAASGGEVGGWSGLRKEESEVIEESYSRRVRCWEERRWTV
jgi:hypothetical protein